VRRARPREAAASSRVRPAKKRHDDLTVLVIRQAPPRSADVVDAYALGAIPADRGKGLALTKPDGTVYHVNLAGRDSTCECLGHLRWSHRTVCKHVAALLALEAAGKL
jgi:hypothetical protein